MTTHLGGSLIASTPPDHIAQFFDTRRGPGKGVTAGYGVGVPEIRVTDPAKVQAALAAKGNKRVVLDRKLPSIGNHGPIRGSSHTLIDGTDWPGAIHGFIDTANCDDVIGLNLTTTQPFSYGKDPAGYCATASNMPRSYQKNCTWFDSGDALSAGGYYQLTPGGKGDLKPPFLATIDSCLLGPNPGEYAIMSPETGRKPGTLGGANNSPVNGKGGNTGIDHTSDGGDTEFGMSAWCIYIDCVFQGIQIRGPKARSQYVAAINCLMTKYGTPFDLGGPSMHHGAAVALDGTAVMSVLGCVFIPLYNGEQITGFQDPIADKHGVPRIRVTQAEMNQAINCEGSAKHSASLRLWGNYLVGQTFDLPLDRRGFDVTPYYSGPITDVSTRTAAQALVTRLASAGNQSSIVRPPRWQDVHRGPSWAA